MDVSAPSATAMMKRLAELGLVERAPYRGVVLTDEGRLGALEVLRHHRLLERYLADSARAVARRGARRGRPARARALGGARGADRRGARLSRPTTRTATRSPTASCGSPTADVALARRPRPRRHARSVARVPDGDPELLRYLAELALVPGAGARADPLGAVRRPGDGAHGQRRARDRPRARGSRRDRVGAAATGFSLSSGLRSRPVPARQSSATGTRVFY